MSDYRRRKGTTDGPERLAAGLHKYMARVGRVDTAVLAKVALSWGEVVGASLAEHSRPTRVQGPTLVIAVDHPARATQMRSTGAAVLARAGELAGREFTSLELVVRPSL